MQLLAVNTAYQVSKSKKQKAAQENKNNKTCPVTTPKSNQFKETLKTNTIKVQKETKNMNSVQKITYFVENVRTGGIFDLKNTEEWKDVTIYYDGMTMEDQDIGNYHFGYIGRALGYDVDFLTTGAGIYQIISGTSKIGWFFTPNFGDDPRDSYYIRMGAIAYDNEN